MISLLLLVFLIHLAIHLINTIGSNTIDQLLWMLYLRLPTSISREAREQQKLKHEVVQLKREMNATSSQDEFAKWAKLRRRHDKALEEFEAKNKALSVKKTSFDFTVKTVRWVSTNGFKIFLQFYYTKTPMFELPPGWFPYYIEWILSFPRAPIGTVSIQIWSGACATAITVAGQGLSSLRALVQTSAQDPAVPSASKPQQGISQPKKEL
jgi:hypothetical protein